MWLLHLQPFRLLLDMNPSSPRPISVFKSAEFQDCLHSLCSHNRVRRPFCSTEFFLAAQSCLSPYTFQLFILEGAKCLLPLSLFIGAEDPPRLLKRFISLTRAGLNLMLGLTKLNRHNPYMRLVDIIAQHRRGDCPNPTRTGFPKSDLPKARHFKNLLSLDIRFCLSNESCLRAFTQDC